MKDCLAKEKLELLQNRKLRGKELFTALKHLEICEKCRSKIILPTKAEILKRFEDDVVTDEALNSTRKTAGKTMS